MNDFELARRYAPHFYADRNDPFPIVGLGYQVLRESGDSPSFRRTLTVEGETAFVIEYAVYYDYDIQHLYDLEHVWIYVGQNGQICGAEASAHGWYLDAYRLREAIEEETHLRVYMQPGKHAMAPRGELFQLYPDYLTSCGALSGKDGVLVPDFLRDRVQKPAGADELTARYIQARYAFVPSMEFVYTPVHDEQLMPVNELIDRIPGRMMRCLEAMAAWEKDGAK